MQIVLGLSTALCWGLGVFLGGFASRKISSYTVVIISQMFAVAMFIALVLVTGERLESPTVLIWSVLSGMFSGVALMLLFYALSVGTMGIVAPVAAVTTGVFTTIVSGIIDGVATPLKLIGFVLALVSVWIIAGRGSIRDIEQPRELLLAIASGALFGVSLTLLDRIGEEGLFLPLSVVRFSAAATLGIPALLLGRFTRPALRDVPAIASSGIIDNLGTAVFTYAAALGRLDVAAVLGLLYPLVPTILARFFLHQHMSLRQWGGVALSMVAVILISL